MTPWQQLCRDVKTYMERARDAPNESEQIINVSCLHAACNAYLQQMRDGDYGAAFTRRIAEVTEWVERGKKPKGHLF